MKNIKNGSLARFVIAGIFFTGIGPSIFWLLLPLGGLLAIGISETTTHVLRFIVFREIVFPSKYGYRVNTRSYLVSVLPVSVVAGALVVLLEGSMGRSEITLLVASASLGIGFMWSRWIYKKSYLDSRNMP